MSRGVLRPLEPLDLREGGEVCVKIERSVQERLKDLIGILGGSSVEEFERYLEEVWRQ
ncbi:MAG: antitoxin family protein [Aeropyrum sp.]|nr:antitoxin family protein [Aeropyrum sp.]